MPATTASTTTVSTRSLVDIVLADDLVYGDCQRLASMAHRSLSLFSIKETSHHGSNLLPLFSLRVKIPSFLIESAPCNAELIDIGGALLLEALGSSSGVAKALSKTKFRFAGRHAHFSILIGKTSPKAELGLLF
ncbi:hypothetical protein CRG98_033200 [Punica granatum]|uniref:Uncharacterized protein n=1 Tax=Punica granatum TaxID=22663 RepID=A0A2I0IQZ5_PUNGR|nr:hypothetical protein CRG98_033200 [Punica granatum]